MKVMHCSSLNNGGCIATGDWFCVIIGETVRRGVLAQLITKEKIQRINELARKQKASGLSDIEQKEQKQLRDEYIQAVRRSLKAQLDSITIVDEDGNPVEPQNKKTLNHDRNVH